MKLASHLYFKLDVFAAQRSGVNPVDALHMSGDKDLRIQPAIPDDEKIRGDQIFQWVEIFEGNMNIKNICETAIEYESKYLIIEQSEFYGVIPMKV